MQVCR